MKLDEFVRAHVQRGACQCGKCCDAVANPEKHQPTGHTADLVFFKVAAKDCPNKETLLELVRTEFPRWLDGKEHSYLECGADIGDQGAALMAMGLGHLLGAWKLLTPAILGIDGDLAMQMAGMGFISIQS